jgi:hypothetical protein
MAITYPTPVVNNTTGDPNVNSLKVGSDNINNAFENIKQEFAAVASSTSNSFDDVNDRIDEIDVVLDDNVLLANLPKPTIDLDFRNNSYEVWQDDANSFTKQPLADAIDITNGGGTLIRPTGLIGSVGANTGRLTTVAGRQGLLVEGARTNECNPSSGFTYSNTTIINTENFGELVISEHEENTANATRVITIGTSGFWTEGVTKTASVYAKERVGGNKRYVVIRTSSAPIGGVIFNVGNGTVTSASSGWAGRITPDGNGLYRCEATHTRASGNGALNIGITNSPTGPGTVGYTGDGASGMWLGGAQGETGATASSLIVTTASAVTRVADNVVRGLGDEFNPSEFTVFCARYHDRSKIVGNPYSPGLSGSATNTIAVPRVSFRMTGVGSNAVVLHMLTGSSAVLLNASAGTLVDKSLNYIAIRVSTQNVSVFINGVKTLDAGDIGYLPSDFSGLSHYHVDHFGSNTKCNTTHEDHRIYPAALSDAQCIALTKGAA